MQKQKNGEKVVFGDNYPILENILQKSSLLTDFIDFCRYEFCGNYSMSAYIIFTQGSVLF
jgi:hypothetical protein